MIVCKCVTKFKDETNKIVGYKLMDESGRFLDIKANDLKQLVDCGEYHVINLTLTSDGRLVDASTKDGYKPNVISVANDKIAFNRGCKAGLKVVRVLEFSDKGALIEAKKSLGTKYIMESRLVNGKVVQAVKKDSEGKPILNPDYVPHLIQEVGKVVGYAILNTSDKAVSYPKIRARVSGSSFRLEFIGEGVIKPGELGVLRRDEALYMLLADHNYEKLTNARLRWPKELKESATKGSNIKMHDREIAENKELTIKDYVSILINDGINSLKHYQIGIKNPDGTWSLRDDAKEMFAEEPLLYEMARRRTTY